jgi:hypothetical protein
MGVCLRRCWINELLDYWIIGFNRRLSQAVCGFLTLAHFMEVLICYIITN